MSAKRKKNTKDTEETVKKSQEMILNPNGAEIQQFYLMLTTVYYTILEEPVLDRLYTERRLFPSTNIYSFSNSLSSTVVPAFETYEEALEYCSLQNIVDFIAEVIVPPWTWIVGLPPNSWNQPVTNLNVRYQSILSNMVLLPGDIPIENVHLILYRQLRNSLHPNGDESNANENGITAKLLDGMVSVLPVGMVSVLEHVTKGSSINSRSLFISTCGSFRALKKYREGSPPYMSNLLGLVAKIKVPAKNVIDLRVKNIRRQHDQNFPKDGYKFDNFSKSRDEVLLEIHISRDNILRVATFESFPCFL